MSYVYVRTRTEGSEYKDDRHHFTNEPTRVSEGEIGSVHLDNPNLLVTRDKSKKSEITPEEPVAPDSDGSNAGT